jgi:hypothetical protein
MTARCRTTAQAGTRSPRRPCRRSGTPAAWCPAWGIRSTRNSTRARRIATEEGLKGPHLTLFEAIGRVHPAIIGRTLPLNGAGVCGAALADLGFHPDTLRGFALLARTAGLLGHLAEEMRRPAGPGIYTQADHSVRYQPPAATSAE